MKYKSDFVRMYYDFKSVNRRQLIALTNRKVKSIKMNHIHSVVNMFLDILNQDLIEKKELNFKNFLNFKINRMPAKKSLNYYTGEIGISKPYNKMFVTIDSKINKVLTENFDIEKALDKKNEK